MGWDMKRGLEGLDHNVFFTTQTLFDVLRIDYKDSNPADEQRLAGNPFVHRRPSARCRDGQSAKAVESRA